MLARCSSASCSGSTGMSWCAGTALRLLAPPQPGRPRLRALRRPRDATQRISRPRSGRCSTTSGRSPTTGTRPRSGATATSCSSRWFTERGETSNGTRSSWRSGTWSWSRRWRRCSRPWAWATCSSRRPARARGRGVVAVDAAARPAPSTTPSWLTWRRASGPSTTRMCCQFIGMVAPRSFMDRYAGIDEPELGFLEYKVPVYAQAFGTPLVARHVLPAVVARGARHVRAPRGPRPWSTPGARRCGSR